MGPVQIYRFTDGIGKDLPPLVPLDNYRFVVDKLKVAADENKRLLERLQKAERMLLEVEAKLARLGKV